MLNSGKRKRCNAVDYCSVGTREYLLANHWYVYRVPFTFIPSSHLHVSQSVKQRGAAAGVGDGAAEEKHSE